MVTVTLDDHLGNIICKARQAANVSIETAAEAAGLSQEEFSRLETSGQSIACPNLAALAALIGLHGPKLEAIANGWLPRAQDLSRWRELRVITTTREGITVNCYMVWDEVSREGALFDTGWDAAPLLQLLGENRVQLKHLFLTHTHEDHIAAMDALREKFPKLHLHTNSKSAPPQHRNRPNDFIHLGSLRITNRETPGHAEDGVTYIVGNWPEDAPHVAMAGDTIFAGSLARGLQSTELLKHKVREQIFTLPPATLLCPGHGPLTSVAEEKAHNPFF
jgi:glyoxylase-like metal-dependent hydrolase (beta-lactamase superfamily II)